MEDVDLPPAFPEWLKRMFPTLRAEETNALFQAFRRRRLLYGGKGSHTWVVARNAKPHAVSALAFAVPLALWYAYKNSSNQDAMYHLVSWVCAAAWGWKLFRDRYPNLVDGGQLPEFVHEVFKPKHSAEGVAIDVWLAGASARDVLEAIYLEQFSMQWIGGPVIQSVVLLLLLNFIGPFASETAGGFVFVPILCTIFAGYVYWGLELALLHERIIDMDLKGRVLEWARSTNPREAAALAKSAPKKTPADARRFSTIIAAFLIPAVLSLIAVAMIQTLIEKNSSPRGVLPPFWLDIKMPMLVSIFMILAAMVIHLVAQQSGKKIEEALEPVLASGEVPLRDLIEKFAEGGGAQ